MDFCASASSPENNAPQEKKIMQMYYFLSYHNTNFNLQDNDNSVINHASQYRIAFLFKWNMEYCWQFTMNLSHFYNS